MVEKHIRSRIQLKHALEKDWLKAVNFVPLKGEVIVYDAERVEDDVPEERKVLDKVTIIIDRPRYKIGDGVTLVSNLPFTSAEGVKSVMSVSLGHTEGYETGVLDYGGHAEGLGTIAATTFSHTEGYSLKDYHDDSSYLVAGQRGFKIISNTVSNGTTILVLNSVEGIESGDSLSFGVPVKQSTLQYAWKPGYIEYEVLSVNQLTNQVVFDGELYYKDETYGITKPFTVIDGVISELPQTLVDYDHRLACSVYFKNKPQIGTLSISCGAHAEGRATRASGDASHAEGRDTEARADYSHAEGRKTIADNEVAHAEGYKSIASGVASHAEGWDTDSVGKASHSEGGATVASGDYSHAEGNASYASGRSAHAEGHSTISRAVASHAEGYNTEASAIGSHAEGLDTFATGESAHTEGYSTRASNTGSHAEGYSTEASAIGAHAEGSDTIASGASAHAEGFNTTASGSGSHAEGGGTVSQGHHSHAEGASTVAQGDYSHSEGVSAKAIGDRSHAEGDSTTANGKASHSEGSSTTTGHEGAHAEGVSSQALGYADHAEGLSTIAKGSASHAEGVNTEASGLYSHAEGEGTVAASRAQHVQGKYNVEDKAGKYAHIVGGGTDNTDKKNIHTLDWNGNATYAGDIHACGDIKVGPRGMKPGEVLSTSTFYEMTYSGYVLVNTGTLTYHSSWESDYYTSEYLPVKLCENVMFKGLAAFTRANIYPMCLYNVAKDCVGAYLPSNDKNTEAHSISVLVDDDFLSSYPHAAYIRVCIKHNYSPVMEYIDGNKQYCYKLNQFSNIACCGDSVTLGRVIEQNQYKDYEIDSQTGLLKHSYPHYLKKMFPLTSITVNAQVGASIDVFMSGVYSEHGFGCVDFDWTTYDLIILEFGLNNGATEGAFTTLVNRIREQNSEAKIVFVRNSHSEFTPGFPQIFESICSKNSECYWIDLTNTEFGNLDAIPYHGKVPEVTPTSGTAQIDYAHFTKRGYLEKAYVIASLIGQKL